MLGSGRIHKRIVSKGTGAKAERSNLARLRIKVPTESFSLAFGTAECEMSLHSECDVLLGDGLDVPPAIELAAYEINVGGEVAIRSHADLRGHLPEAFSVELVEILKKNLLKLADSSKEEGNKLWKASDLSKALLFYQRGIRLIQEFQSEAEDSELSRELWTKIMKNIGRCHFKLKQHTKSLEKFNEILAVDPKNLSVLDLKGDVLLKDKNYAQLHQLCEIALKCDGMTENIREKMMKRIETCKKEKLKQDEKHKAMCARMFKLNDTKLESTPPNKVTSPRQEASSNFSRNVTIGAVLAVVLAIGAWQAKKHLL